MAQIVNFPITAVEASAQDDQFVSVEGLITSVSWPFRSNQKAFAIENASGRFTFREIPEVHGGTTGSPQAGMFARVDGWLQPLRFAEAIASEVEVVTAPTIQMLPIRWTKGVAKPSWLQICDAMGQIETPALKAFIDAVYTQPGVFGRFVDAPASFANHHAYPGGLVEHTAEGLALGLSLPTAAFSNAESREVVLVAFAIHDLGKIDLYDRSRFAIYPISHELRGMVHCGAAFAALRKAQPSMAEFLLYLLDAKCRHADSGTPEVHVFNAMDRVSAARARSVMLFADAPTKSVISTQDNGRARTIYRALRRDVH